MHTSGGYRGAVREDSPGMPSLHFSSALLQLISIFQKGAYTLVLSPIFVTAVQGTSQDCLALVAIRAYGCDPTRLYTFVFFNHCCLRVWLPIRLNLGANWDPPFRILTDTGTHSTAVSY